MKVRLKIMSRVKFTLFELLCYLFNLHLILIAYLVLIRRTLGTEQTLTIIDKIYWPYWPMIIFIYVFFPILSSLLALITNKAKKRLHMRNRSIVLNVLIMMVLFLVIVKLPYIEFIHANQDYKCQMCFKPSEDIKPNEINRQSEFRWLGLSLFTFTITDISIRNRKKN